MPPEGLNRRLSIACVELAGMSMPPFPPRHDRHRVTGSRPSPAYAPFRIVAAACALLIALVGLHAVSLMLDESAYTGPDSFQPAQPTR